MRSLLKLLALGVMFAFGAAVLPGALAVDKAQVIKDRQALMKENGGNIGTIKGYLDGNVDLAKATAAAADLVQILLIVTDVFPPGTEGPNPEGKFAAKPEIWSDWNEFIARRDAAAGKADVLLLKMKTGDKEKIQAAFADLGKDGCGACHGKFREELKK